MLAKRSRIAFPPRLFPGPQDTRPGAIAPLALSWTQAGANNSSAAIRAIQIFEARGFWSARDL